MLFNLSCTNVFTSGKRMEQNPTKCIYTVLLKTSKEKDLAVTISADWKVSEQCGIAARKGNQLLGMIKINYYNISRKKYHSRLTTSRILYSSLQTSFEERYRY